MSSPDDGRSIASAFDVGQKVLCTRNHITKKPIPCEILRKRWSPTERKAVEYYVHFLSENRRNDRWMPEDSLRGFASKADEAAALRQHSKMSPLATAAPGRRVTRGDKRKFEQMTLAEPNPEDMDPEMAELEKDHIEATKVKNVDQIQIGEYAVDTWYYSPYPAAFTHERKLYICEFCLKYMKRYSTLERHQRECQHRHPPGNEIYRHGYVSVFEVDGADSKVYAQCLCLLAKLFLDHKTLYFDVAPFLFYVMCENSPRGSHIVGYFSKEKVSAECNLACILTFPQFQRKGYGRFLIELSYEISKREGRIGSPERPLSDLGKVSYRSYWTEVLLRVLAENNSNMSIKEMSAATAIKQNDIVSTLQHLGLIHYYRGEHVVSVTPAVIRKHLEHVNKKGRKGLFEPSALVWQPPPPPPTGRGKGKRKG